MAGLDEGQSEVVEAIRSLPPTDNQQVHRDLAAAVTRLKRNWAVLLVDKASEWIRAPYGEWLAEDFGAMIVHLAEAGADPAISLARTALELRLDKRSPPDADAPTFVSFPRRLRARYEPWHYRRMVEMLQPALASADLTAALELWAELLSRATSLSRGRSDSGAYDGSNIWRPSLSEAAAYRKNDPEDALVDALMQTARTFLKSGEAGWPPVLDVLDRQPWSVFRRVALFLMTELDSPLDVVEPRLTDREYFDDPVSRVEYGALFAKVFGSVTETCRETVLSWIEQGPDLEEDAAAFEHFHGRPPTDEELRQRRDHWELLRLHPLASGLAGAWRDRYDALVAEFGEPSEARSGASATYVGPTSPLTKEGLAAMSVDEVLGFLRTWEPGTRWDGPSREGLQHILTAVVAEVPAPYAEAALEFRGEEATYVRGLLAGFTEATRNEKRFEWSPVLGLMRWVMEQQGQPRAARAGVGDRDPHWGWAIREVASLLSRGLEQGTCEIPEDLREIVWPVIVDLTADPDPTLEHETEFGGDNMDPTTLALNTIRGAGMNTLFRYGLWLRRREEGGEGDERQLAAGFDAMPEVRDVLNERLDPDTEPSAAVRSTYGRWFPWIVLLDSTWAADNVTRIFGVDEADELGHAAWDAYLDYVAPYDNVLPVLRGRYLAACRALAETSQRKPIERSPLFGEVPQHTEEEAKLAEHLMTFYWRGALAESCGRELLEAFYEFAPQTVRSHALEFIGRSLHNTESLDAEVRERLVALWEERVGVARELGERRELRAFGFWFSSGLFDPSWAREQLAAVLSCAGEIEHETDVAERLATMSSSAPVDVIELFRLLVDAATEGWAIHAWKDQLFEPLSIGMRHEGSARDAAISLINRLGELGFHEFRPLLTEQR